MWIEVENIKIRLSEKHIKKTLDLPEGDVNEWSLDYDVHEAYSLMTDLPCDRNDSKQAQLTSFNTNSFPPLQRLIHHLFTTIITPQGGGRRTLTKTQ